MLKSLGRQYSPAALRAVVSSVESTWVRGEIKATALVDARP